MLRVPLVLLLAPGVRASGVGSGLAAVPLALTDPGAPHRQRAQSKQAGEPQPAQEQVRATPSAPRTPAGVGQPVRNHSCGLLLRHWHGAARSRLRA